MYITEVPQSETTSMLTSSTEVPTINGNNSTILSLLANTSAQSSPSSSATNITLSNLLTSSNTRSMNSNTVNVTGPRVVAKRLKMPNAARVISGTQQVTTSLGSAVIAAATNSSNASTINAQPVIRLSLSSLTNQVK